MKNNRLAVNIFFFGNGFLYTNWISRLPKLQELYSLDYSLTGIVLLIAAIGALIAMPFTGYLIIKNGSKKITILSGLIFCLTIPFIPVFHEIWQLSILFFLMGFSTGTMDVAMNAQAVLVENAYQKPIMSSFHAVFSLGCTLGAGSGALFTYLQTPFFYHLGLNTIIVLLAVFWAINNLVPDKILKMSKAEDPSFRLPDKKLLALGIIAFCCMLGEGAMADWGTNYMKYIVFSEPGFAPLGLASFNLTMMIGRFLGDKGRVLFGDHKLLLINSLIAIIGMVIVLFPVHEISVIIGFAMVGFGLSVIVPIAYSKSGTMEGLSPGVGIAMVTTIGYAGFIIGPPIIGFIADWTTLRIALFFVFGLFLIMGWLSFIQAKKAQFSNL